MANFTEKAIRDAFLELLNERALNKITVKDITDRCGVNRNTFYYHFQDIPTLIQQIFTLEAERIISENPSIESLEKAVDVSTDLLLKNRKAILHIYNSANRELFEQYFFDVCGCTVDIYLKTAFAAANISEADKQLISDYYRCAIFGAVLGWLQKGMQDDISVRTKRLLRLRRGFSEEMIRRCETLPPES